MIGPEDLNEGRRILGDFETDGPFMRLAELLSPACRIEPELMRHMRTRLVRDADVSVEQALWFSDLVRSRGHDAICFSVAIIHLLRQRLRTRRQNDRALVERARDVMADVHAELSPVLVMEETLAWAEVFDDQAGIRSRADSVLEALNAGRSGLDTWLARAWDGLPSAFKDTPSGRNLAQIAALRGAAIDPPDAAHLDVTRVAHLLPRTPVLFSRRGTTLQLGTPRSEATHAMEVPDTVPIVVEVRFKRDGREVSEYLEVRPDSKPLEVGAGPVKLRCVDGSEFSLESKARHDLFSIEMLPARQGSCLLLRYGMRDAPSHVVVDGGPNRSVAAQLHSRLEEASVPPRIELLVVTHIDSDRIRGVLSLLGDDAHREIEVRDVWFNGPDHHPGVSQERRP